MCLAPFFVSIISLQIGHGYVVLMNPSFRLYPDVKLLACAFVVLNLLRLCSFRYLRSYKLKHKKNYKGQDKTNVLIH